MYLLGCGTRGSRIVKTASKEVRGYGMPYGLLGCPQDHLPTAVIAEPPLAPDPQLLGRPARQQHRPVDLKVKPKFGEQNWRPRKFHSEPPVLHFRRRELHMDDRAIVAQVLAQLDGCKIAQARG